MTLDGNIRSNLVTSQMQITHNSQRQSRLAALLVNLAQSGWRGSRRYKGLQGADLCDAFRSHLLPETAARIGEVTSAGARLAAVANALRPVFEAPTDREAASELNASTQRYGARPYLAEDVGQPFHLHFHGDAETVVELLAGEFATALALLMDNYGQCRSAFVRRPTAIRCMSM